MILKVLYVFLLIQLVYCKFFHIYFTIFRVLIFSKIVKANCVSMDMLTEDNLINHDLINNENDQEPAISMNKNDKILQLLIDNLTKDLERVISIKKAVVDRKSVV